MNKTRLLLIHDVCLDHKMWDPHVATLESIAEIVRYDLIGHGSTPPLNRPLHIDDFVRQARRELALAGMDSAVVVGIGLGGIVAEALAVAHPHQVDALALLSTPFKRSDTQTNKLLDRIMASEIDFLDEDATGNELTPYVLPYRIFATLDSQFADGLENLSCPAMVATGSLDTDARPASTKKLGRLLGTNDVHIVEGEGPLSDPTHPNVVTKIIADFLRIL